MKIEVLREEKDLLEFKLKGERHSFPGLLVNNLLKHENVEFASYKLEHPMDKDSVIIVKTSGKSPKKILLDCSKQVRQDMDEFAKKAKQALK